MRLPTCKIFTSQDTRLEQIVTDNIYVCYILHALGHVIEWNTIYMISLVIAVMLPSVIQADQVGQSILSSCINCL